MAKKKSSPIVYTPISSYSPPISNTIPDIPQYSDRGISYQGYAKIPIGNAEYKLKKQDTRFYSTGYGAGASSTTGSRSNATTHFYYGKTINLSYRFTADTIIIIYDTQTSNPKFAHAIPLGSGFISINLDDCPRTFSGSSIIIATLTLGGAPLVLAGAEFVYLSMFGWDEEI